MTLGFGAESVIAIDVGIRYREDFLSTGEPDPPGQEAVPSGRRQAWRYSR